MRGLLGGASAQRAERSARQGDTGYAADDTCACESQHQGDAHKHRARAVLRLQVAQTGSVAGRGICPAGRADERNSPEDEAGARGQSRSPSRA